MWCYYCIRVAEMSNHDADFIMRKMPYARGLQFQGVYYRKHGIEIDSGMEKASLDMIIE